MSVGCSAPFLGPSREELRLRIEELEEELETAREDRAVAVARAEDAEEKLFEVLQAIAEGLCDKLSYGKKSYDGGGGTDVA